MPEEFKCSICPEDILTVRTNMLDDKETVITIGKESVYLTHEDATTLASEILRLVNASQD